jgi:hypothetical protein
MKIRARTGSAALLIAPFVITPLLAVSSCSGDALDAAPTTAPATTAGTTVAPTMAPVPPGDIVATALTAVNFTTLAGMVYDAGLVETLRSAGPFTVFAPSNDAFAKLPTDVLRSVQNDPKTLTTVLTFHVVPGRFTLDDLRSIADGSGSVPTVAGIDLTVTRSGDDVSVNGVRIAVGDIDASNGVIHVVTDVLVPPAR